MPLPSKKEKLPRNANRLKGTMPKKLKPIDFKIVDKLLEAGCLGTEIAGYFGVHEDTLYLRTQSEKKMTFTQYSAQKRSKGDSFLRSKQFEIALLGDKTMLVWLGKTRLGQREMNDLTELKDHITVLWNKASEKEQKENATESEA